MIHSSEKLEEQEKDGKCNLEVVGVRYTGPRSSKPAQDLRRNSAWPGNSPFQGGPIKKWVNADGEEFSTDDVDHVRNVDTVLEREAGPMQIGLVPDWTDEDVENRTLDYIESSESFEVVYDPEEIKKALAERGFLPKDVFGRKFEDTKREKVFEKLDIEDRGVVTSREEEAKYREQLVDVEDEESDVDDTGLEGDLKDGYPRSELSKAAGAFGYEGNRNKASKSDFAEFLSNFERSEVLKTLENDDYEPDLE